MLRDVTSLLRWCANPIKATGLQPAFRNMTASRRGLRRE
ncbi:hypothetical protein ACPOL_3737 [Acidisarcina polymorpha]|uniref:Uncharacterized protein n=1 Tax=Acidisarcina polymorpha TaxID=2211140 RepID=A0A2Z5G3B4_9BACT|nr:hypothetical protein ACPOL_3737 [Acidisarcina polymorpha]